MISERIQSLKEWKQRVLPAWWPHWFCLHKPAVLTSVVGLALGFGISWWINRPWMEWEWITATYRLGDFRIALVGQYDVNRDCWRQGGQVLWRTEARATDGQIALYGPGEATPSLTVGSHRYEGEIALVEKINPDGWQVFVIVTCPGETPESVVSPAARVDVLWQNPP